LCRQWCWSSLRRIWWSICKLMPNLE
jgi:hypothetical protein